MIRKIIKGDISSGWYTGVQEVTQLLDCRLSLIAGEYRRNIDVGMPWQHLLGQNPIDLLQIETYIKNIVLDTDGVKEITKMDVAKIGRSLTVNLIVESIYGNINVEKII